MDDIDKLKRNAKRIAKERNIPHCKALDILANQLGYSNWSQFHKDTMKAMQLQKQEIRGGNNWN